MVAVSEISVEQEVVRNLLFAVEMATQEGVRLCHPIHCPTLMVALRTVPLLDTRYSFVYHGALQQQSAASAGFFLALDDVARSEYVRTML